MTDAVRTSPPGGTWPEPCQTRSPWRGICLAIGCIAGCFAALFAFRAFAFQTFSTPSSSMTPTLLVGDYFVVSKYAYGYSRFSLPFSPTLFAGRM